jgi:hypothetical protein
MHDVPSGPSATITPMSTREQFDARIDPRDAIGLPTSAPIERVRDVLIETNSDVDVSPDEFEAHPPIAWPSDFGITASRAPVDLGRDLRLDRLPDDEAELVMNACSLRGHFFAPIRQHRQSMAFVREIDLDAWREHNFHWDRDGVISDALMLSRLVRDNGQSMQYAARIADFADGEKTVVYTLPADTKHAYRLRRDRDWLDPDEGIELRDLLTAYWASEGTLPGRVERAIFRAEYTSWIRWADITAPILVSGLESLLKTEQHGSTHQFKTRVPALAGDLGFDGITAAFCERMYAARSEWVHGAHVRLFSTGLEAEQADEQGAPEGPEDAAQRDALADIARVQDVLRRTVRRCIEDESFRAIFADDERIRSRWPI